MSANTNPIFPATIISTVSQVTELAAGDVESFFIPGESGSQISHIVANNSNETEEIVVNIMLASGMSPMLTVGTFTITAGAGHSTPAVSLMPTILLNEDGKLLIGRSSDGDRPALLISPTTDMPMGMHLTIGVLAGDY